VAISFSPRGWPAATVEEALNGSDAHPLTQPWAAWAAQAEQRGRHLSALARRVGTTLTRTCVRFHACTHSRARARTSKHMRTHACMHARNVACTRMHARTHACMLASSCIHAPKRAYTMHLRPTRACMYACTHTYTHARTHARTHAHTHARTHAHRWSPPSKAAMNVSRALFVVFKTSGGKAWNPSGYLKPLS